VAGRLTRSPTVVFAKVRMRYGIFDHQMLAGIEVLIKTADGEVELFHQIGNGDTFEAFLAETFGSGPHDARMSFDFLIL
jgi:hypothetical protein